MPGLAGSEKASSTVIQMIGIAAASAKESAAGFLVMSSAGPVTYEPSEPPSMPSTWSPTCRCVTPSPSATTTPAQSPPIGPGSPGRA